jgi:hypothetical protein
MFAVKAKSLPYSGAPEALFLSLVLLVAAAKKKRKNG